MGAPAISTAPRRAKPRRAPAAKPRRAAATKPRGAAAKPRPRAAAKPRPRTAAKARPTTRRRAAKRPQRARSASGPRVAAAGAGNVVMLPVAAVGGIADSGLIARLTRGRAWIVVLGLLLGGIVAINVLGLDLSASSSSTEARIDALQSDNGVLRARNAKLLSTEEIQQRAAALGLAIPAPDAIHYLDANGSDAAKAAKRLAAGEIVVGDPAVTASDAASDPAATIDPATTTSVPTAPTTPAVDPTTGLPAIDPTTGAPITPVDPATGAVVSP